MGRTPPPSRTLRPTDTVSALHWIAAQPNVPLDAPGVALLVLGLAAAHILGVARLQIHRVAEALFGGSIPRRAAVFHNRRPFHFVRASLCFGDQAGNIRVDLRNRSTVEDLAPVRDPGGVAYDKRERRCIGRTLGGTECVGIEERWWRVEDGVKEDGEYERVGGRKPPSFPLALAPPPAIFPSTPLPFHFMSAMGGLRACGDCGRHRTSWEEGGWSACSTSRSTFPATEEDPVLASSIARTPSCMQPPPHAHTPPAQTRAHPLLPAPARAPAALHPNARGTFPFTPAPPFSAAFSSFPFSATSDRKKPSARAQGLGRVGAGSAGGNKDGPNLAIGDDVEDEDELKYPDYKFRPVHNKRGAAGAASASNPAPAPPQPALRTTSAKGQLSPQEDERRCEEVAALLLQGKKGEELASAVRDLDWRRQAELAHSTPSPVPASYHQNSKYPHPLQLDPHYYPHGPALPPSSTLTSSHASASGSGSGAGSPYSLPMLMPLQQDPTWRHRPLLERAPPERLRVTLRAVHVRAHRQRDRPPRARRLHAPPAAERGPPARHQRQRKRGRAHVFSWAGTGVGSSISYPRPSFSFGSGSGFGFGSGGPCGSFSFAGAFGGASGGQWQLRSAGTVRSGSGGAADAACAAATEAQGQGYLSYMDALTASAPYADAHPHDNQRAEDGQQRGKERDEDEETYTPFEFPMEEAMHFAHDLGSSIDMGSPAREGEDGDGDGGCGRRMRAMRMTFARSLSVPGASHAPRARGSGPHAQRARVKVVQGGERAAGRWDVARACALGMRMGCWSNPRDSFRLEAHLLAAKHFLGRRQRVYRHSRRAAQLAQIQKLPLPLLLLALPPLQLPLAQIWHLVVNPFNVLEALVRDAFVQDGTVNFAKIKLRHPGTIPAARKKRLLGIATTGKQGDRRTRISCPRPSCDRKQKRVSTGASARLYGSEVRRAHSLRSVTPRTAALSRMGGQQGGE
ncbi:hypothetical protein C8F04DRAFT_1177218 [Mycena alexandri]|uniref:Uncharacterized protein n=1 Tax=Mycena alexandri TaxID=1745969 RepID=A0AAD6T8L8_9AGAR|nr:hypothetical protein C8F04DRAFT_1177218 [Mycena alexandri]